MIETLLVPHDLTELADAGLDALQLIGTPIRQIHVLHVLPRIDLATPTIVWSRDEDEDRLRHGRDALRTWLMGTRWEQAILHVGIGDPASRIVSLATEIDAQLISMASHGRTGMQRLALGSVAEHVARFATCPVLIVPARASLPVTEDPAVPALTPEDQVDALGAEITRRVAANTGYLTAVRIGLPPGEDPTWWDEALTGRLATAGIAFVDLVFAPGTGPRAEILATTFEERFV